METRQCKCCKNNLELNKFTQTKNQDGSIRIRTECKKCRSEKECQRRRDNLDKYKEKDKNYYEANKETILEKNKNYRLLHRDEIILQKRQYYLDNREIILQYHQNNKSIRNEKKRLRFKIDVAFRITESLRARIHDVLKNAKVDTTNQLIGCSKNQLLAWLEYQFDDMIEWDNYGTIWQIDHTIPVNWFVITDRNEQLLCFNWSNLRPLRKRDNSEKSDKILQHEIVNHMQVVSDYIKINTEYQAILEIKWWRRIELRYGNNLQDVEDFDSLLKWAIRSQAPKFDNDEDMEKVQRLNDNGSKLLNQQLGRLKI